ncbi:MAG: glycosyltransferase family 2 protein [Ruminococcus flavefaciens]|nr:glycosyltransferase family 2 protein [Ruminococcus flavefaciens]
MKTVKSENLVSVLIPIYNCRKYVRRAVNSVLIQSYTNFELLLIDDGSTDGTSEICDHLKTMDARICVYHKENGGLADARNYGIEKSKGKYICFLDADDEYKEKYIEILFELCEKNKTQMSVCGYISKFENGDTIDSLVYKTDRVLDHSEAMREFAMNRYLTAHSWTKMYRAELIKKVKYPKGKAYEDIYVMPELLDECGNIAFSNKHLIYYNQIDGSITHSRNIRHGLDAFDATIKKFIHYKEMPGLYSYLIKEPLEIAIRLKWQFRNKEKREYLTEFSDIDGFLDNAGKYTESYKLLSVKFKILLLFHKLL